jgi:myo-inositol 2-dehydrogenase / D-chiro-inositol 1-dehydrogenase
MSIRPCAPSKLLQVIAQISNSRRSSYGYDQHIEVQGAKGMLSVGNRTTTTLTVATEAGYTSAPALPFLLERYAEADRAELDSFIAAVARRQAPST